MARQMPAWKVGLVVFSVLVSVAGLGLMGYAAVTREAEVVSRSGSGVAAAGGATNAGGAATGFVGGNGGSPTSWPTGPTLPGGLPNPFPDGVPTGDPPPDDQTRPTTGDPRWIDDASPAVFRLGFSFFVGFALAFAFRRFIRVSLVGIGVLFFLMFGLSYLGLIEVRWDAASGAFDRIGSWLGAQFGSFREFVTGHLPSAASASAGMVVGYRKN